MIQKSITIDLWKEYRQPIDLVQYEAEGRTLNITLTNGGQVVDLTGASVTFNMTKGADVIYNACTNVDETAGKISLLITGATCDTAGTFDAFIEIVKTDDVLRTQNFDVTVKPSVDNSGAIESTSEFTALQAELAQISTNESNIATNTSDIAAIDADYVPRATFVNENIVIADGTDGEVKDSTKSLSDLMDSVGSEVVDENIVVFDGTGGKAVKDSGIPYTNISNKNYIINGNFDINQRVVSGSVVLGAGEYGHDRFKAGSSGCSYTFATSEGVTTITISAGSLIQIVEGATLQTSNYTLSWDGTANGELDGGSAAASPITEAITGGANVTVEFGTGTLSLVKLEKGSVATPFVPKSIREELADCRRYYWRGELEGDNTIFYNTAGGSRFAASYSFTSPMRVEPTITIITTPNYLNCNTPVFIVTVDGITLTVTTTGTGVYRVQSGVYEADAEL